MFCQNCGKEFSDGAFCPNCGAAQEVQPVQQSQPQYQPTQSVQGKKYTGVLSLVFGVASNIIAWFVAILGLGLAIAGLITGCVSKVKGAGGMAVAGIVLSSVGILSSVISWIIGVAILSML